MQYTPYSKLPYFEAGDTPDLSGYTAQLTTLLDGSPGLVAVDTADRDSRYGDTPAGTIVVTSSGWVWVKTSNPPDAATWATVRSVETITGSGLAMNNPSWTDTGDSIITRIGNAVDLYLSMTYQGTTTLSGNFGNQIMSTLPSGWVPARTVSMIGNVAASAACFGVIFGKSTRDADITDTNGTIATGASVVFSASWVLSNV